ncbi:MAG: hypothetical protein ABI811_07430 [Acidobacteriota bacterium]
MKKIAKTLALVAGGVMLLIGILSFLPTGIVGPGGMLIRYQNVPFLYIVSGLALMAFSTMGESWAAFGLYSVALLHALVGGLAYTQIGPTGTSTLFGVLRLTQGDMVLHGVIAVVLAICGKMNTARQQVIWD